MGSQEIAGGKMDQKPQYEALQKAHMKAAFFATKPTPGTIFLRTFLPWQMVRFVWINLKMVVIIRRSHQTHQTAPKRAAEKAAL